MSQRCAGDAHTCVATLDEDVWEERDVVAGNVPLRDQQRRHILVLNVSGELVEQIDHAGRRSVAQRERFVVGDNPFIVVCLRHDENVRCKHSVPYARVVLGEQLNPLLAISGQPIGQLQIA